jgi:hypothetical protein
MSNRFLLSLLKCASLALMPLLLLACGGETTGFTPVVTAFKAQTV